jgi:hypothetical protein
MRRMKSNLALLLVLIVGGSIAVPSASAQQSASLFFCPCPDCSHRGFVKSLDQCGCRTSSVIKEQLRALEKKGRTVEEIKTSILGQYHDDLAICTNGSSCPAPAGPQRMVIPGYRDRADRETLRCSSCDSELTSLEIGDSALTTPPARGIGIVLRIAGPFIGGLGLILVVFVARRWKARTGETSSAENVRLSAEDRARVAEALDAEERGYSS